MEAPADVLVLTGTLPVLPVPLGQEVVVSVRAVHPEVRILRHYPLVLTQGSRRTLTPLCTVPLSFTFAV